MINKKKRKIKKRAKILTTMMKSEGRVFGQKESIYGRSNGFCEVPFFFLQSQSQEASP